MLCDSLDIADHYKLLAETFRVPDELLVFAGFDTVEAAAAAAAAAESKRLAAIKQAKDMRRESIDRTMLTIIEMAGQMLEVSPEEIVESIADTVNKTESLHHFFKKNGAESLVFSYSPKLNEDDRINILHEKEFFQTDQCFVAYRADNTSEVTPKNMMTVLFTVDFFLKKF